MSVPWRDMAEHTWRESKRLSEGATTYSPLVIAATAIPEPAPTPAPIAVPFFPAASSHGYWRAGIVLRTIHVDYGQNGKDWQ
jgi:hypothetical protein